MKFLAPYIIIPILSLCIFCTKKRSAGADCFEYPKQIDSLNARDLYDTARWYIYSWLGDKVSDYRKGELKLRYRYFFQQNDSIELFFEFLSPEPPDKNGEIDVVSYPSIGFNTKTRQKLWGWDINGFSNGIGPGETRFDNPRSREVVNFIKTNQSRLHPCFIALAKKMKVIE